MKSRALSDKGFKIALLMKTTSLIFLVAVLGVMSVSQAKKSPQEKPMNVVLVKPIQQNVPAKDLENILLGHIKKMETIKVGMTRADLEKYFYHNQGGISPVHYDWYHYKECPNIWVDVKFEKIDKDQRNPKDKIIEISKPYVTSMSYNAVD